MFLGNIYRNTSHNLTYFNLRVDGANTFLPDDDAQIDNGYKNLVTAFMPFHEFEYDGLVKNTNVYDLLKLTLKNAFDLGPSDSPMNFLTTSAIGAYGFAEVIQAQWLKECVNLELYNRSLTYNQELSNFIFSEFSIFIWAKL